MQKQYSTILYKYSKKFIESFAHNKSVVGDIVYPHYYGFNVLGLQGFLAQASGGKIDDDFRAILADISKQDLPLPLDLLATIYFKGDTQQSIDSLINYAKKETAYEMECLVIGDSPKYFFTSNEKFAKTLAKNFADMNKLNRAYNIKVVD